MRKRLAHDINWNRTDTAARIIQNRVRLFVLQEKSKRIRQKLSELSKLRKKRAPKSVLSPSNIVLLHKLLNIARTKLSHTTEVIKWFLKDITLKRLTKIKILFNLYCLNN